MAFKSVVDKLDDLPEAFREHYKAGKDGKFYLETEKGDISGLLNAKDHEKNLRVAAETERDGLKTQVDTLTGQVTTLTGERDTARQERDDKKSADVQAIEKSWSEKYTKLENENRGVIDGLTGEVERLLVTNVSQSMAAEISTVPDLFGDVIAKRLKVEKGADGKYFTRVLDNEGKPSALTLDELKQDLLANEKYSAIMISGKGSGGGANGSAKGGGAADGNKTFWQYSDAELVELRKSDPEKYKRLRAAETGVKA